MSSIHVTDKRKDTLHIKVLMYFALKTMEATELHVAHA